MLWPAFPVKEKKTCRIACIYEEDVVEHVENTSTAIETYTIWKPNYKVQSFCKRPRYHPIQICIFNLSLSACAYNMNALLFPQ